MSSDRILGVLAVLLGVGMAATAWGYAAQVEYEPVEIGRASCRERV